MSKARWEEISSDWLGSKMVGSLSSELPWIAALLRSNWGLEPDLWMELPVGGAISLSTWDVSSAFVLASVVSNSFSLFISLLPRTGSSLRPAINQSKNSLLPGYQPTPQSHTHKLFGKPYHGVTCPVVKIQYKKKYLDNSAQHNCYKEETVSLLYWEKLVIACIRIIYIIFIKKKEKKKWSLYWIPSFNNEKPRWSNSFLSWNFPNFNWKLLKLANYLKIRTLLCNRTTKETDDIKLLQLT